MRRIGRHGAALPGLIAERLRPGLIRKLTHLPEGIIVVSGTNGKTTTTHLTTQVLRKTGKKVFTNHSGSNMTRGLLASIVRYASITGKLPYDVAVLEIDEAYASKLAPILKPKGVILTNVLRDQLDRFGEIDHTADLLFKLASESTGVVVYNSCDSRLSRIGSMDISAKPIAYGYANDLYKHFPDDDAWYDSSTKQRDVKSDYTLVSSHEGVTGIKLVNGPKISVSTSRLPGWHNALNLVSVVALINELYGPQNESVYSDLTPPYGRGESIEVNGCKLLLQLVKNPAGFRTAMDVEPLLPALIIINDAIADSRDVSWLWDVDTSPLATRPSISCAGTRAYDMAVRLKYADIDVADTTTDIFNSVDKFISSNSSGVVFLTYTSMLKTRAYLNNKLKSGVVAK